MNKMIAVPLSLAAFAAAAVPASANTASFEVPARCDANGDIVVQSNHEHFPHTPSIVQDQINADGHPAQTVPGWEHEVLDSAGDYGHAVVDSSRWGYKIHLGPGMHNVTVYSRWAIQGDYQWHVYGPEPHLVNCGPVPPTIIYVPVPSPPRELPRPVCKRYQKTLLVTVGDSKGHSSARMTRVNVYLDNVLVKRPQNVNNETYEVTLKRIPCGTHKVRVTASIRYRGKHSTATKRATVRDSGLDTVSMRLKTFNA